MLGNYGAHLRFQHMTDVGKNFGGDGQAGQAEQAELPFFPDGGVKGDEPVAQVAQAKDLDAVGASPFLAEIEAELRKSGAGVSEPAVEPKAGKKPVRLDRKTSAAASVPPPVFAEPSSAVADREPAPKPVRLAASAPPRERPPLAKLPRPEGRAGLGALLREARVKAGFSLGQVEFSTKIKTHLIEALERDDYSNMPSGIYLRAYIKTVSDLYGVDSSAALAAFAMPDESRTHVPSSVLQDLESGKQVNKDEEAKIERVAKILVTVFSLLFVSVVLFLGLLWLNNRHGSSRQPIQPLTDGQKLELTAQLERLVVPESVPMSELPIPADDK